MSASQSFSVLIRGSFGLESGGLLRRWRSRLELPAASRLHACMTCARAASPACAVRGINNEQWQVSTTHLTARGLPGTQHLHAVVQSYISSSSLHGSVQWPSVLLPKTDSHVLVKSKSCSLGYFQRISQPALSMLPGLCSQPFQSSTFF